MLGTCFRDVVSVAAVVVAGVSNIPSINCMRRPGESLVWGFVDEDFCTWGVYGGLLKSKALLSWASAECFGLMLDGRNIFSLVVHCFPMRSYRRSGKFGFALVIPAKKCSFHLPMAF